MVAGTRSAGSAQARGGVHCPRARRADRGAPRPRAARGRATGGIEARRATAAAGDAPTVLALGGPRVADFEELLAEQDLVVVATPSGMDPALRRLALSGLAAGASRACACEISPAQLGRAAAASGLLLLPSARRPLADAVEALS